MTIPELPELRGQLTYCTKNLVCLMMTEWRASAALSLQDFRIT
jgi:hypothetical protein